MLDQLVPIRKAAKLLGVGISTLRSWDKSGEFRAVRTPGGHRRYRLGDIKHFQEIKQEVRNE